MATGLKGFKNYVDLYGPSGGAIAYANIALTATTGVVTLTENQGFATITLGAAGVYTLTLLKKCKNVNVTLGLQCATAAQSIIIASANPTTGVIVLNVVAAGAGTPVAPGANMTVHVQVIQRNAT